MNNILERQNEEKFLRRLAAQRQLYDEEKRWINVWLLTTTLVAVIGSGALAVLHNLAYYLALVTGLVAVTELVMLWIIRQRGTHAARIQELFDTELLDIPWNDMLARKPEGSVIEAAAERFNARTTPAERDLLKNWYSNRIAPMPLHQARVACQMENIQWDMEQRKEYARWVGGGLFALACILVLISIATDMRAQVFFAGPFVLCLPLFIMGIKHLIDHIKAIARMGELKQLVDTLWNDAQEPGANLEKMQQQSRNLQTEIFHHRADSLPVFSWFYDRIREKYDRKMKAELSDKN